MKVNGNDKVIDSCSSSSDFDNPYTSVWSNIPIRLDIATRILVGLVVGTHSMQKNKVELSLAYADSLIKAHNDSSEKND